MGFLVLEAGAGEGVGKGCVCVCVWGGGGVWRLLLNLQAGDTAARF